MNEKLVAVAHFDNSIDADVARQLLEEEGIQAFVMGQHTGILWGTPLVDDIELHTPESQAEEARRILEAHEQEKLDREEDAKYQSEEDLEDEPEPEEAPDEEQE
jgi:hypothetical protein